MKNNKCYILSVTILAGIAALLDLKYKGLFYRQLPESVQERLNQCNAQTLCRSK
ncbi:hypothetical protein [Virgibacillus sediminis]|uniref:Cyclic lactone autoinducer peptide n=1 Tax=Virgibacillus sediminis TaxID=202260 RepID=A0ABV7A4T8_9BACI